MTYNILVSFNAEKVFPSFGSIINEVNLHMEGFGFGEKLSVRANRVVMATLTYPIELILEEKVAVSTAYAKTFAEKFPGSNPEVELVAQ